MPAKRSQQRREEARARRAAQRRPRRPSVDDQPDEPEPDVEDGQDVGAETVDHERGCPDLTQASPGLDGREGAGDERDQPTLPRADGDSSSQALHRREHSG